MASDDDHTLSPEEIGAKAAEEGQGPIARKLRESLDNIEAVRLFNEGGLPAVRAQQLRKKGAPKLTSVDGGKDDKNLPPQKELTSPKN